MELLLLLKPHRKLFVFALVALGAGSLVNLAIPEIVRRLINSGDLSLVVENLTPLLFALAGLFLFQAVCFYFRSFLFSVIGIRIVNSLRTQLYDQLISRNLTFFDQHRTGDLISRISSDTSLLQDILSIRLSVTIRYTFQVVVGVVLMALLSLRLTLLLTLILPLVVGCSVYLGKKLKRLSKLQQQELGNATNVSEETFGGIRTVKAFHQEVFEQNRFGNAILKTIDAGFARSRVSAFFASFVSFLMNVAIIGILLYGIRLVALSQMNAGDLTAFMLYGVIVAISFAFLAGGIGELLQASGAAERIFEILNAPHEKPREDKKTPTAPGNVDIKEVSFAYPSRPNEEVLHNISFSLSPGKTVALVGPSGSGKSTVMNLLLAFYEPTRGELLLGGVSYADLSLRTIRNHIAIVPQEPQLFALSIRENLLYGKRDASDEELAEACEKAYLSSFIQSLPEGLETYVGERGVQLSGGQKQRLAIARALLKNPSILLFDEATSSLDSESEHEIQKALSTLRENRACLIIAHRLSTVQNADEILVLDKGKIIQRGDHFTLREQGGLYRSLVEKQDLASEGYNGTVSP